MIRLYRAFSTCPASFEGLIASRKSCRKYMNKNVPEETINKVLSETLTAPTARNIQPYRIVLIRDKKNLQELSKCMFGHNGDIIKQAPGVAVFLADTRFCFTSPLPVEFGKTVKEYTNLCKRQGQEMNEASVAEMFKGIENSLPQSGYSTSSWCIKQSVFPMELFTIACQANGLSTVIMEGFNGQLVSKVIECPDRFFVSGIVPFGYAEEMPSKASLRYDSREMVFDEKFGKNHEGIEEFKRNELSVC